MIAALREELLRLADDSRIRAVVLAANGPAFSAGHDLKEITARRADADGGHEADACNDDAFHAWKSLTA